MAAQKANKSGKSKNSQKGFLSGIKTDSAAPNVFSCPARYENKKGTIFDGEAKKPKAAAGINAINMSRRFFTIYKKVFLTNITRLNYTSKCPS